MSNPITTLLLDLLMVSEGKVGNPDSTGGGKPGSSVPTGDESLHDHFARRIFGAKTRAGLEAAVAEARLQLSIATGGVKRPLPPGAYLHKDTIEWKRAIAADITSGAEMKQTMRLFDCSRSTYYRIKRDYT